MTSQTLNNPTNTIAATTATAPAELFVPAAVCDALAGRVRTAGLFLLAAGVDGTLSYHDIGAEAFFTRYALPLLRKLQESESPVRQAVRSLTVLPLSSTR